MQGTGAGDGSRMAKLPAGACKDEQLPGKQILEQLVKGRTGMCTSGTGLLEDIRYGEQERAELAWIGFWYLIYKGFQEIYGFMKDGLVITFQTLCRLTKEKHQEPFYGISYLCIAFLFAEELGVEIKKNEPYSALYPCMQRCIKKWGSSR